MNISGIASKVASNADLLGGVAALLQPWPVTGGNRLDSVISSVQQLAAGVFHMPDIALTVQEWFNTEGKTAIMAYIAAEILDAVNPPFVGKYAGAIKKAALGYAGVSAGVRVLYNSTHSEIKGVNIENSRSVQQNFAAAPLVSSYNY